jgi:hypothetical protein
MKKINRWKRWILILTEDKLLADMPKLIMPIQMFLEWITWQLIEFNFPWNFTHMSKSKVFWTLSLMVNGMRQIDDLFHLNKQLIEEVDEEW